MSTISYEDIPAPYRTGLRMTTVLAPRYQPIRLLGRGTMGEVYHARDLEHDREVAVKVLLAGGDPTLPRRFRREAEHLQRARHENVVGVLDFDDGVLVMEYLAGGDLAARLEARRGLLPAFVGVCTGLAHLHALGLVHRDLKPGNVLMASDGTPKLADFGLSLAADSESAALTAAGTLLGTFAYVAPEQVTESHVGPAADMYSLGVCLFQAVTGRLPFEAASLFALLRAHARETPPPAGVDADLDRLIARLLAKAPAERPTAVETLEVLRGLA